MIVIFFLVLILWVFVCCVVIGLCIEKWWHERKNTTTLTVANGSGFYVGMDITIGDEVLKVTKIIDGCTFTVKR